MKEIYPIFSTTIRSAMAWGAECYEILWAYIVLVVVYVVYAFPWLFTDHTSMPVSFSDFSSKFQRKSNRVGFERYSASPQRGLLTVSARSDTRLRAINIILTGENKKRFTAMSAKSFVSLCSRANLFAKTIPGSAARRTKSLTFMELRRTESHGLSAILAILLVGFSFGREEFRHTPMSAFFRTTVITIRSCAFYREWLSAFNAVFQYLATLPVNCLFACFTGCAARTRTEFRGTFSGLLNLEFFPAGLTDKRNHSSLPMGRCISRSVGTFHRTKFSVFSPSRIVEFILANWACFGDRFHAYIIPQSEHSLYSSQEI
jgi:hypothetical protein